MVIANPIFDSVFKYLLQNLEAAQLLIELVTRHNIKTITPINKDFIKAAKKSSSMTSTSKKTASILPAPPKTKKAKKKPSS